MKTTIPRCPPHLSDTAKKEWRRVSKDLAAVGLMTKLDRAALAVYCQSWARWIEAEDHLRADGVIHTAGNGKLSASPYLLIANSAMAQMMKALSEFGMSPSSRTRVKSTLPTEKSEFQKFLDS